MNTLLTSPAQASLSPTVVIWPIPAMIGGTVNFDVTAAVSNTIMFPIPYTPPVPVCSIAVVDPNGDTFQLQAAGVPATITLPDAGDSIRLTYPVATFAALVDPDLDVTITPGALAWVHVGGPGINPAPHTLVIGTYAFETGGVEGISAMFYFDVTTFFVIPFAPLGALGIVGACFAGFAAIKLRRKK